MKSLHSVRSLFALLFVLVLAPTLGLAADPALAASGEVYHKAGKVLSDMIVSKQIEPGTVATQVDLMVKQAVTLAEHYGKAHPNGAPLLKTVIANIPAMRSLDFGQLEAQWHDLGYFDQPEHNPGIDLKDEDNEHFTDPIHAIVHPLLVLKAAQAYVADKDPEHLKAMKEELEEGMEQAEKLIASLSR
jgi:hypothetical protein